MQTIMAEEIKTCRQYISTCTGMIRVNILKVRRLVTGTLVDSAQLPDIHVVLH